MVNNKYSDKKGRYEIKPTTIETVDQSVFDYFDKRLSPSIEVERGRNKVPIHFASGERWKLLKKNKFRDNQGTLILPIISIKRVDMDRTPGFGGMAQEGGSITISNVVHSKTGNVQNLIKQRGIKGFPEIRKPQVVREYLTIPFPDFVTISYTITIWTQFETQMNEILEKIFYKYDWHDSFVMPVEYDGHKAKGDSYYFVGFREGNIIKESNDEDFTDQERIIKYNYTIKTPAYLMMDPKDETLSYGREDGKQVVYKRQNAIKVKLKEEIVSFEDFIKLYG